ncbi:MAG: hypothetical protein EP314_04400, partial [Bacteroidetes bacterium]
MSKGIFRKRNIGFLIKTVIALVALWFIYREIQLKEQDANISSGISVLADNLLLLLALIVLMMLNWGSEA